MTEKTQTTTKPAVETTKVEEPTVAAAEVQAPAPVLDPNGVDKLPSNVVLADSPTELAAADTGVATAIGHVYNDEHTGKGGSYTFNDKGERVPVYEKFVDTDGATRYRPVR